MHLLLRLHIRLVTLAIPLLDRWLSLPRLVRLLIAGPKWQPYRRVPVATISLLVHAALRRPRWMKPRAPFGGPAGIDAFCRRATQYGSPTLTRPLLGHGERRRHHGAVPARYAHADFCAI